MECREKERKEFEMKREEKKGVGTECMGIDYNSFVYCWCGFIFVSYMYMP